MKKMIAIMIVTAAFGLFAQKNMGAIKAGMFFPQACDGGFDLGFEYGYHIDTNLDVGLSLDWFKKDYEDKAAKGEYEDIPGLTADQVAKLSETIIYDFPLMVSVTAKFPINNKMKWFATGGLGAEMLYASYNSYDSDEIDEKSELAFDFNWRLGGGIMYNLGARSEIFGELAYHYSKPSYEYEDEIGGVDYTLEREYDMSGILSRVGVRFFIK
ncbi:MAG: outer membrane beta-barrel protein [Candidatus Delongbacteria bacterium]|jgi:opacity protein-like surface antigen|nr:outer membrane beta-barrel protein [Candidatus Delongbacteria bacterium]MDD4204765.1 outer membrane beta-barrel protein [Candidatus Delongbacteria bacterium]